MLAQRLCVCGDYISFVVMSYYPSDHGMCILPTCLTKTSNTMLQAILETVFDAVESADEDVARAGVDVIAAMAPLSSQLTDCGVHQVLYLV